MHNIYMISDNNDAISVFKAQKGALLFRFNPNFNENPISDSIAWNRTKFCMQFTYIKG